MDPEFVIPFLSGILVGIVFGAILVVTVLFKILQKMVRMGVDAQEREKQMQADIGHVYSWARNPRNPGNRD